MKILLVDDQVIFRNGLKNVLENFSKEIEFTEVNRVDGALRCLEEYFFDLIIADLELPDSLGMNTVIKLKKKVNETNFDQRITKEDSKLTTRILMLSGNDRPEIMREAVANGASGFVPKSASDSFLISVIQFVINGGIYLPPNTLDRWERPHSIIENERSLATVLPSVSKRQSEVLENVIQGKPNKVIARELNIAEGTVKAHLSQLFRVLGVKNRTEAVYAVTRSKKPAK